MTFFSRPILDDIQFKQPIGSELSLSGQTRFRSWSGLTLSDGGNGDILLTVSGASSGTTEGYVLTYLNGLISLQPSSASGVTSVFDTHRETTRNGIPQVCVGGTCTVNNFLEGYFFPPTGPETSLSIATGGSTREFGDCSVGNLCYEAIRGTNQICLVAINDDGNSGYDTCPVTTPIAGDCNDTTSYTFQFSCATPATGTSQTSVSFDILVEDTITCSATTSSSITWRNKRFTLKTSTLYTDDSITAALSGGELSTTRDKTITNEVFNNHFFYYIYPTSFGIPNFTVNGLPNNAWGSIDVNTLFIIDYTNVNGYSNQYYVARSDNRITGTYNINIS